MENYDDGAGTFDHVDDWLDDEEDDDDWLDDEEEESCEERRGCMPDPEDFDD